MRGFCYSAWNKFLTNVSTAEITVLAVAPDSNAVPCARPLTTTKRPSGRDQQQRAACRLGDRF
jgi:hypothetical protein